MINNLFSRVHFQREQIIRWRAAGRTWTEIDMMLNPGISASAERVREIERCFSLISDNTIEREE